MTVQHKSIVDSLIAEFNRRNPEKKVVIDYATGVEDDTGFSAEITVPEKDNESALILIDAESHVSHVIGCVAEGLATIEAGYYSEEGVQHAAAEHYYGFVENWFQREKGGVH